MSRSAILHDTSQIPSSNMTRRSPVREQAVNPSSKLYGCVQEKPLAHELVHATCNLEVGVNGKEVFRLHMKPLLARCGLLVKLVDEANAIRPRDTDSLKSVLTVELENFPGGPEAFELVARFCYNESDVVVNLSNVTMLRCVAEFLEMTEEYGKGNLHRKTEYFLKHEVFWNWTDTLCVLKSCEPFLAVAEKADLIQRCSKALAFRASASPDGLSDPSSFSSDSHDLNSSIGSSSSRSSIKSPLSGNWWFQDLSTLPVYLMQRVVKALLKNGIDHKILSKFLLHYLRSSLPHYKGGSFSVLGSSLSPSNSGRISDDEKVQNSSNIQLEILETVVQILSGLQPRALSCRSLFSLLRTAAVVNGSKSCRREIERLIGMQLDKATLDNILVPSLPRRSSSLYDVDLIVRLTEHFLQDQAESLSGFPLTPDSERKRENELNYDISSPVRAVLLRVSELIDKYLAEVAADSHLKSSKFRMLAEVLPDTARNSSDGLYRAVEIFLEAHPSLPIAEATGLCRVINLQKLGLEACKRVAQNPKFPASFVLQVLLVHQSQLRSAMDTCIPRDLQDIKCKPSKEVCTYNKEGRANRQALVVHLECSNFEFMIRQNQDLKRNLKKMHSRVAELESTYKRLRVEMGRLFKTKCRPKTNHEPQQQFPE